MAPVASSLISYQFEQRLDAYHSPYNVYKLYFNNNLVGHIAFWEHKTSITIAMILVDLKYQNMGLGRQLVLKMLEYADERGKTLLTGSLTGSGTELFRSMANAEMIKIRMPIPEEQWKDQYFQETMLVVSSI